MPHRTITARLPECNPHAGHPNFPPVGRRHRCAADRLHPPARQEPPLRPGVAAPRPHRSLDQASPRLGCAPGHQGHDARDRAPRWPHAGHLLRRARQGQRHRVLLRPPRQAARDGRLALELGPVDAGDRGRTALRPRRGRRRLRDLRRALGDRRPGCRGHRAPALRGPHRDLRGKRQLRPPGLPRGARAPHGQCRAGDRARFGRRQLRAALGHDVAARPGERNTRGRGPHRGRALGRCGWCRSRVLPARAPVARSRGRFAHRRREGTRLRLRGALRACRAGEAGGADPRRDDLEALPLGHVQRPNTSLKLSLRLPPRHCRRCCRRTRPTTRA